MIYWQLLTSIYSERRKTKREWLTMLFKTDFSIFLPNYKEYFSYKLNNFYRLLASIDSLIKRFKIENYRERNFFFRERIYHFQLLMSIKFKYLKENYSNDSRLVEKTKTWLITLINIVNQFSYFKKINKLNHSFSREMINSVYVIQFN